MKYFLGVLLCSLFLAGTVQADSYGSRHYSVSITNLTKGVMFTPFIAATHKYPVTFYELGQPASIELAAVAEGGDIAPLSEKLSAMPDKVSAVANTSGLVMPGETVTLTIKSKRQYNYLSLAAMLLPTNDTFVALNRFRLPLWGAETRLLQAYDAGSEENDELCISIPGPLCGGEGGSPGADGEGYVYISPGIHGEGELSRSAHDWRSAVAQVTIQRIW